MSPPINFDGSEIQRATIDGQDVSEITIDGNKATNFGPDVPNSVALLYEFEDNSNTSVAVDSVGSNNGTISGSTYNVDEAVGSRAISHQSGDLVQSSTAVDYVTAGSQVAVALSCFCKPASATNNQFITPFGWGKDKTNKLVVFEGGGTWKTGLQVNGIGPNLGSNVNLNPQSYQHIVAYATQSEIGIYVNNTLQATASHSKDIAQIGSGTFETGTLNIGGPAYPGLVDDAAVLTRKPTSADVNTLFQRSV